MSARLLVSLLLAAGLAACKPITSPHVLRDLGPRQDVLPKTGTCANPGSSMVTALAALESRVQGEITELKTENTLIVKINVNDRGNRNTDEDKVGDNREGKAQDKEKAIADAARKKVENAVTQQLVLQQVNQALLTDQQANAAANEMDNVFRAVALAQKEPKRSTVLLVVQEVKASIELEVQVDDEKRKIRKVDASIFKQEIVVANRGKQETDTIMVYDPRTLTATNAAANPGATNAVNGTLPAEVSATKTVAAVVYNAKPTHSHIIEDPAKSMRAALESALEDRQKREHRAEDVELSAEIAIKIKIETEKNNDRNNDKNNDNNRIDNKDESQEERDREREQERERQQKVEQQDQDQERESKKADQQRQDEEKKQVEKDVEREVKQAERQDAHEKGQAEARAQAEQEEIERKKRVNEETEKAEK